MPNPVPEAIFWTPQLLGALFGAAAGGAISIIIGLSKWFFTRRDIKRTIERGLYYEIDNHLIHDQGFDAKGRPNMYCTSFHNSFYSSNLSSISQLLDSDFLQKLSFYYNKFRLANGFQENVIKLRFETKELLAESYSSDVDKAAIAEIQMKDKQQMLDNYEDLLRRTMLPVAHLREQLLSDLKHTFNGKDPTKLPFIEAPAKYKAWWDSINKEI